MSNYYGFAQSKCAKRLHIELIDTGGAEVPWGSFFNFYNFFLCFYAWMIFFQQITALALQGVLPWMQSASQTRCPRDQKSTAEQQTSHRPLSVCEFTDNQTIVRMVYPPVLFSEKLEGWKKKKKWLRDLNRKEVVTAQLGETGILFTWRYAERN